MYVGNVPGAEGESTLCPGCGEHIVECRGPSLIENWIRSGRRAGCGREIAGVGMDGA